MSNTTDYRYYDEKPEHTHRYLWPAIRKILSGYYGERRIFEIGCGNGSTANMLHEMDYEVTGVDLSKSGVEIAQTKYNHLKVFQGNAYDNLADKYGIFPVVISLEVIEHCYYPRKFAKTFFDLLDKQGIGIISTPYHGYIKNLALAIAGKMDSHYSPLWDGGHIKFYSKKTLTALLQETGFTEIRFMLVGRIPPIAKSMIAIVRK